MAEIKILLNGDELKEKEELEKLIKSLSTTKKERLRGFLTGLKFMD